MYDKLGIIIFIIDFPTQKYKVLKDGMLYGIFD